MEDLQTRRKYLPTVVFTVNAYEGFHLFVRVGSSVWGCCIGFVFLVLVFWCVCGGGVFFLHICLCTLFMQYPQTRKGVKPLKLELRGESSKPKVVYSETGSQLQAGLKFSSGSQRQAEMIFLPPPPAEVTGAPPHTWVLLFMVIPRTNCPKQKSPQNIY